MAQNEFWQGNKAIAMGAIAAGCRYFGGYPITPSTEIMEVMSEELPKLGGKFVQMEDEIGGIASALGASIAGKKAMTASSGPGISLKQELLGYGYIAEIPLVVADVQRGGPSTGLPTKTEQSDLVQALYGRNGECPVVVMAASTPSDCFHFAFEAGRIAMEHMTPVILLTDGFIANGSEPWRIPSMKDYPTIVPPIVDKAPEGGFMPYVRNEKLARGWAFPGKVGLEHRVGGLEKDSVKGSISHDPANHQKMVQTRQAKIDKIADYIPEVQVVGDEDADLLIVGWGGTYGHLYEAMEDMQAQGKKVALAHFKFINPLPKNTAEVLGRYKKVVVAEQNNGQFANYLRGKVPGFEPYQFNRVKGQPFVVARLVEEFTKILEA